MDSITSLLKGYRKKHYTPYEITETLLKKIKMNNDETNEFISITEEIALQHAEVLTKQINNKDLVGNNLFGVPGTLKDNIFLKNAKLTNGSEICKGNIPQTDAALVNQLKSKNAIILGKNNLTEFAASVSSKNQSFGDVVNSLDSRYTAGGSSSGSAVTVANKNAFFSIGTDTSGSIRIPAVCNGIVGFKPSFNVIPNTGVFPLSQSLDHVGILTRTVDDAEIVFKQLVPNYKRDFPIIKDNKHIKIGIPKNYYWYNHDENISIFFEEVIKDLERNEFKLIPIDFSFLNDEDLYTSRKIGTYEMNEYFMKAFTKDEKKNNTFIQNLMENGQKIGVEQYHYALNEQKRLSYSFDNCLSEIDILVTPTMPIFPPEIKVLESQPVFEDEMVKYTHTQNITGLPAISLPTHKLYKGIPFSIQVISKKYNDYMLLDIAKKIIKYI